MLAPGGSAQIQCNCDLNWNLWKWYEWWFCYLLNHYRQEIKGTTALKNLFCIAIFEPSWFTINVDIRITSGEKFCFFALIECTIERWFFNSPLPPLTSEGLKYPPKVRVRHETCSTICGTPVQAILDQKNLTGSAGGAREGQNMAHLGHFNGKCAKMHYFDLPWPTLPTRSNFFGQKWLVHVSHI